MSSEYIFDVCVCDKRGSGFVDWAINKRSVGPLICFRRCKTVVGVWDVGPGMIREPIIVPRGLSASTLVKAWAVWSNAVNSLAIFSVLLITFRGKVGSSRTKGRSSK